MVLGTLAVKRRQSEQVKRQRRVSRGAQGADKGGGGDGSEKWTRPPSQKIFYYLTSNDEHFGAVFKLDLTEETRTQLQEEEAIASYWLRLRLQPTKAFKRILKQNERMS